MKILISGAGIAGLTLAVWLHRKNHDLTVIEKSPTLREEGYMLDFFGSGYDVSERMGLLSDFEEIHYPISRPAFMLQMFLLHPCLFPFTPKTLRKNIHLFDTLAYDFCYGSCVSRDQKTYGL